MTFKSKHLLFSAVLAAVAIFFQTATCFAQALPQQQQLQAAPQTEYSDSQLERFVDASVKINEIQQGAQVEMVEIIEGQGLNVETFNEMASQQRNPNQEAMSVSDEDKMAFGQAMQQIQALQLELQQEMESAIIASDLQLEEYNEIMQAYQQNPELQQKVHSMMQR